MWLIPLLPQGRVLCFFFFLNTVLLCAVHVMCSNGKMHCLKILMVLWSLPNLNSHKTSWAFLLTPRASQLQVAFADCAADIKSTYESQDARQTAPSWLASSLNHIAVLFLRAGRTQEAW